MMGDVRWPSGRGGGGRGEIPEMTVSGAPRIRCSLFFADESRGMNDRRNTFTSYELVRAEEVILYAAPLRLKFSESTRVEHITVNCRPSLLGKHTSAAPLAHL